MGDHLPPRSNQAQGQQGQGFGQEGQEDDPHRSPTGHAISLKRSGTESEGHAQTKHDPPYPGGQHGEGYGMGSEHRPCRDALANA